KAEEMARQGLEILKKRAGKENVVSAEPLRVLRDILLFQQKYAEAQGLLEGPLPMEIGLQPQSAELLCVRGDLRGRIGHSREAVDDFSKLIELEPEDHERYWSLAPLLVQTGDLDTYRRLCQQIRTRFASATNNSIIAHRMSRVCLLLPASGAE